MGYMSLDKGLYRKIEGETPEIEDVLEKIKEKGGIDTLIDEVDKLKHFYKYTVGDILTKILENAPQAEGKYVRLVEKLQELDKRKSSLIKDREALYQCIGKYYFRIGIMIGINRYIESYGEFLSKPGKLEKFINDLETLVDDEVIKGLYKLYQEVKEQNLKYLLDVNKYNHLVSQEGIIITSYELASKFVADLIFRHLLGYISLETAI
jgi:hypothetical protein